MCGGKKDGQGFCAENPLIALFQHIDLTVIQLSVSSHDDDHVSDVSANHSLSTLRV